ncbi:hypothetical protein B0A54_00514 [Friedmanniomyces endolithicus]|uniref:AAA+ ATPase domain-containing protein n=1 Tax=Friedmanniomyces endolithicus TaxID=329885 RepID=A0A4V5N9P3_9PEZI|nr:hypothetical protein LTS09_015006 [Friedmanniomyces endolithicus]TKA48379.1 hypothetical protein B0A54_00514 [Friedmanniomyces endolithicus]
MGHYASGDMLESTQSSSPKLAVLTAFQEHCSGKRINTELAVVEGIRAIHPGKHVTTVAPRSVDLFGYAKAGHAEAKLVTTGDSYQSLRAYRAPGSRMESGDGQLSDDVGFGHYEYKWNGEVFPMYHVAWADETMGLQSFHYILSDREAGDAVHSVAADRLVIKCGKWSSELHEEIYVFDNGHWQKNEDLWKAVQSASWDDVILDPAMKETLINDVHGFFDNRAVYEEVSVPWKRGIIMHGTPGCGKTISIKALMHSLQDKGVASLYVKSFDACQGLQYSIRSIFAHARVMALCLLLFEDLDSLVVDEVRSYFLNEVDGIESNDGICMIGSTNHLERLDPGISKRPSRFDRKYHYKLPGHQERILYCEYWRKKLSKRSDLGITDEVCEIVANVTDGFSFAYMKELFVQALLAIVGGRDEDEDMTDASVSVAADSVKVVGDSAKLAKEGETTESTADATSSNSTPEKTEKDSKAARVPRKVPEVEVPEHLQDNAFLRVLRKQIVALVKDMDNTTDEAAAPKPKIA